MLVTAGNYRELLETAGNFKITIVAQGDWNDDNPVLNSTKIAFQMWVT